jgi:hypothetical protein
VPNSRYGELPILSVCLNIYLLLVPSSSTEKVGKALERGAIFLSVTIIKF